MFDRDNIESLKNEVSQNISYTLEPSPLPTSYIPQNDKMWKIVKKKPVRHTVEPLYLV